MQVYVQVADPLRSSQGDRDETTTGNPYSYLFTPNEGVPGRKWPSSRHKQEDERD